MIIKRALKVKRENRTARPPHDAAANLQVDDGQLETAYRAALEAYADRVESFACLPDVFRRCMVDGRHDHAAHGLTADEWREYLQAFVEHVAEGDKLAVLASERLDRMRQRERDRVSCLEGQQLHDELQALHGRPHITGIQDGESMRAYIMRRERDHEALAVYVGRVQGAAAAVDRALRGGIPDAPRPGRRTSTKKAPCGSRR